MISGLFIGTVILVCTLLNFALVLEGLLTLARAVLRMIFPALQTERPGWFTYWGAWHLIVIMLLMRLYGDDVRSQLNAFALDPLAWSSFQMYQLYVVIPLTFSFIVSHLHMYFTTVLSRR